MKNINRYKLLTGIFAASMLASCDYEDINTNPFEMTEEEGVMDGFAVGGLITNMEKIVLPTGTQAEDTGPVNDYQIAFHLSADCWSGFFGQNNTWNSGNCNVNYYLHDPWITTTYSYTYTKALDPWKKLKAASEKNNTPEIFALAQILKISAWHKALETFGPMPYSHAADETTNIPFDSEKDIYEAIFNDLSKAIEVLTEKAVSGIKVMPDYDVVYEGNSEKWVKYANSLLLRLAMRVRFADESLAKKYASQALKHSIGVMKEKGDEAQMSSGAGIVLRNPIYWLADQYDETRMGSSMFSYLVGYQDPRLSSYFQPANAASTVAQQAFDGKKYQAIPAGHIHSKKGLADNDSQCYYYFSKPNIKGDTPTFWLRTSEVLFLRAEAALVWGGEFGDASSLYQQGIEMSFQENGINSSADSYMNSGKSPIQHQVTGRYGFNYQTPTHTTVKFEGTQEEKLEKIMIQKWIALYPNGQEAWTEWRRTGYPKLNPVLENRGSAQGVTKDKGIRRMIYPNSFKNTSETQAIYQDAIKKLSNGKDSPTTTLWWDCK